MNNGCYITIVKQQYNIIPYNTNFENFNYGTHYFIIYRLSQTCNHVAALLFKIESAFRLDLSNPAKTSLANEWLSPSTAKGPLNMKLQDMEFVKPTFSKGNVTRKATTFHSDILF